MHTIHIYQNDKILQNENPNITISDTVIASFYGMNFEYMPHLHWEYGPYGVVVSII